MICRLRLGSRAGLHALELRQLVVSSCVRATCKSWYILPFKWLPGFYGYKCVSIRNCKPWVVGSFHHPDRWIRDGREYYIHTSILPETCHKGLLMHSPDIQNLLLVYKIKYIKVVGSSPAVYIFPKCQVRRALGSSWPSILPAYLWLSRCVWNSAYLLTLCVVIVSCYAV